MWAELLDEAWSEAEAELMKPCPKCRRTLNTHYERLAVPAGRRLWRWLPCDDSCFWCDGYDTQ